MDYLVREFEKYKNARKEGKTFEDFAPLKALAFQSLFIKINSFLPKRSKILEVGFGSGYFLSLLSINGHQVFGIEKSETALNYAKLVFKEKNQNSDSLIIGNGFKLPFPDNYFDLVFNVGVIEHFSVKEQRLFLEEMKRVSKKFILISIPNNSYGSLYYNFKRISKIYIDETENTINLQYLVKLLNLKPIKYSGFLIVNTTNLVYKELNKLYKKYKFIPKEKYSSNDIGDLLKFELKVSDQELFDYGFLRFFLAKK
jgi:ubiquinone/menaquinone biosynthesis C-methylase UbiE